ncbi:hypothetical protein D3C75_1018090 [compost metagenome]
MCPRKSESRVNWGNNGRTVRIATVSSLSPFAVWSRQALLLDGNRCLNWPVLPTRGWTRNAENCRTTYPHVRKMYIGQKKQLIPRNSLRNLNIILNIHRLYPHLWISYSWPYVYNDPMPHKDFLGLYTVFTGHVDNFIHISLCMISGPSTAYGGCVYLPAGLPERAIHRQEQP